MSRTPVTAALSLALVVALPLFAASALPAGEADLASRAATAFSAQDWPLAERLYGELLGEKSLQGQAAFRQAVARLYLGRVAEARAGLDRAEREGFQPAAAIAYRRACADALERKNADAIALLEKAVAGGFSQLALLDSEPLLEPLRADPEFAKVRVALERAAHPCRFDERYRAFDFWVGEWDVRPSGAPDSTPPSENIVTLEYDGCVVMEHWTSTGGGTGSSFNMFDASRDAWFQTWVDAAGGWHEYRGAPDKEGNMRLQGETPGAPGQPARVPTKLSLLRLGPDSIRQLAEISLDGGKTWTTSYDLVYKRRPKR